jgi:hypothetical protein
MDPSALAVGTDIFSGYDPLAAAGILRFMLRHEDSAKADGLPGRVEEIF